MVFMCFIYPANLRKRKRLQEILEFLQSFFFLSIAPLKYIELDLIDYVYGNHINGAAENRTE